MATTRKRRRRGAHMIKQAIITTYLGPTNSHGSRIKATSGSGKSITVPFDYDGSATDSHERAAYALADKLGWAGTLRGGGTKNGYCWVFVK